MLRTVRIGRTVYRIGLEKRQLGRRERLLSFLLTMTIPSHCIYIATTVTPDTYNANVTTKNISGGAGFRRASPYTVLTTVLAVLLSAIGIVLWLLAGSSMYFIALGTLHLALEVAPLTARTALDVAHLRSLCGLLLLIARGV
jgi:hypothetical protein